MWSRRSGTAIECQYRAENNPYYIGTSSYPDPMLCCDRSAHQGDRRTPDYQCMKPGACTEGLRTNILEALASMVRARVSSQQYRLLRLHKFSRRLAIEVQ